MKLWFPRYVRDLAEDVDYLHELSPEERDWYDRFRDEYYGATPRGISSPEQIAESNRAKQRLRHDLFSTGLRSDADISGTVQKSKQLPLRDRDVVLVAPEVSEQDPRLDTPEAQELLRRLRELRPEFDTKDGRRRAKFRSRLAETRFNQLSKKLQELLHG